LLRGTQTKGEDMDRILFAAVLLLAYLAGCLFIKYDNKRIEAECKFMKRSDYTDKA
jgi:hypothetical protein